MFNKQSNLNTIFCVFAFFLIATLIGAESRAQTSSLVPAETIDRALRIADQIETRKLVIQTSENLDLSELDGETKSGRLRKLRFMSMDSAVLRDYAPLDKILPLYKSEAVRQNSERDTAIADIILLQDKLQSDGLEIKVLDEFHRRLRNYQSNPDWVVAQRAVLMEAILPLSQGNYDVALKDTQAALKLIPNELSDDVLEAQYETFDQISFLQMRLNYIDLGIGTTEQLIDKGLEQNRRIDGLGIINNMAYVFNNWHEYETAEKLSEKLFRLSTSSGEKVDGLTFYRYGQAQINAEHYAEALKTFDNAFANTDGLKLKANIELARATAFAGLGQEQNALEYLSKFETLRKQVELSDSEIEERRLSVQALLAISNNDAKDSARLLNARLKAKVQFLLTEQSKGIQSLQANLENDKNRVAEREAALMRETELKQSELEAKQRSNMFLSALAISLLLIAISAIGFAVWRQKISKILAIAAHDAEAGDRAKSQFLSVMSHELRTPLNGIIGIAGILSEKGETKELRNYNRLILKSGENLLELLSGILDMAQMESGKLSIITAPASIRQIIDGLYQAAKADVDETRVQFTCFVSEEVPDDLMLDSIRVKQALSNLISNAVRFTQKGRIHIHTTMSEPNKKGVRELTMIVADTGRGINDTVKEKLFKPFVQADSSLTRTHDGAGIGLAVTRGLSRLMGGDVTLTSTVGRGSEFTMVVKTVTASEAKFDPETNRPVFEVVPSASTKIDFSPAVSIEKLRADAAEKEKARINEDLYGGQEDTDPLPAPDAVPAPAQQPIAFDDNNDAEFETIGGLNAPVNSPAPVIEEQTAALLSQNPRAGFSRQQPRSDSTEIEPDQLSGLNILIVEDIEANQEILRSLLEPVGCAVSCAANGEIALEMMHSQTFDAVLMDIRMPVLDGIETTKAIRNLAEPLCNTAIIALTADASAANNAECLAAGADVFLTKPVIVSELFSSIRFARRKQQRQKSQVLSA